MKWEKEYKANYWLTEDDVFLSLIETYLIPDDVNTKVKIKCKDGCIQIERVK